MQANPILSEIRSTRDKIARESGYDVRQMMDRVREREKSACKAVKPISKEEKILH